jgi:hypothetical protein
MDDGAPAHIEEILAQSQIPGASSLPLPHMSQAMLNSYPFAQLGTSRRRSVGAGATRIASLRQDGC